jgi:hypothetical protein
VSVVVARDSLEESHQGVGSRRAAHGAEPLPETLSLVSCNVAEYRARLQNVVRERLDVALAPYLNEPIDTGVVEAPRPVTPSAETR